MKKVAISLFTSAILFTGCSAGGLNKEAEKTSNAFYTRLQQKDYAAATLLCSDKAFKTESQDAWIRAFKKNAALLGKLVSFKQTSGFNINVSTSTGTTIKMAFDVQWQYGQSKDSVYLIKEKDGSMKIFHYSWQHSNTKCLEVINESEALAAKYMNAVKAVDYKAAVAFCSEEALKATPRDKWAAFLTTAARQYGPLESYTILGDRSTYNIEAPGDAGKGNYYDIFVQTKRGNKTVMEKIVFFQKNYDEPAKLTGHYFL